MRKIIPRKVLAKKAVFIGFIGIVLGCSLYAYYNNQDFISNFQPYYIKSYWSLISQKIEDNDFGKKSKTNSIILANSGDAVNFPTERQKQSFAESVPVITYHGIVSGEDPANISFENFKKQMEALKNAGWQTVSIYDFYDFIRDKKELPDKSFLLTFDDGRKDSYYPVDPILKVLGYRAVMYVIVGRSLSDDPKMRNSSFHLNEMEIKKMHESGRWDIQAHTKEGHDIYLIDGSGNKGHFYSNKFWLKDENRLESDEEFRGRIYDDFLSAKENIAKKIGARAISFAFPFGDYGQLSVNFKESQNIVLKTANLVYDMAFYQVWPGKDYYFNYPDKDDFLLKRISVDSGWSGQDLLNKLKAGKSKAVSYSDDLSGDNGWIRSWGDLNFGGDGMMISANASTAGSASFLDGSYLWSDYIFNAKLKLVKGKTFSLMARYGDNDNYVFCSFNEDGIRIDEIVNGKKRNIAERKGKFSFKNKERKIGIGAYDNTVNCYLDDKIAMKGYNLSQNLNHGGIGFKTWDPQANNSELIVKNISVEEIKQ